MARPKRRYGNPSGKTVDAYRGVSAEALRAKRLAEKTPEGQKDEDRLVSYDPSDVRRAIEAGLCPFCGAGPYSVIAQHVSVKHGIDRRELRDLAGLTYGAVICDPAHSRRRADSARSSGTPWLTYSGVHKSKKLSKAGKDVLAESARKNFQLSDSEKQSERGRKANSEEARERRAETRKARQGTYKRPERRKPVECGTKRAYDVGCRCDSCKAANAEAARNYRAGARKPCTRCGGPKLAGGRGARLCESCNPTDLPGAATDA